MLKKLLRSVREYKRDSLLTALFAALEVAMEVMIPLFMAKLIDDGIYGGSMNALAKLGVWAMAFVAVALVCGLLAGTMAAKASAGFARNLRQDMYSHIQDFSFANMDKFSTASLVTRLTTDVTNVQNAYVMVIRVAVRAPLMLIFSLAVSFSINVKLSLLFLCMIPVLGVGLYCLVKKAHPIFEGVFRIYDTLNRVVQENLQGIRVVKSFVREDFEREKFGAVSSRLYGDFRKAEGLTALNMPLMQLVVYVCMVLVCWFGARMIVLSGGTELSTGELSSLITYAMQILTSLMMLSMVLVMITIAQSSAERIVELLEEESDLHDPAHPLEQVRDGSIRFEQVGFSYTKDPKALCLSHLNLNIPSGATVGIVGSTGSGKSSLVQMIPRLYDVTEGRVLVGGEDVRTYSLNALRNQVAVVLQKNVLFSGTIKENLRWGNASASDEAIVHACRLAQADAFIQAFPDGYDTYIEQGGTNVSGGQKQRLCIARALLKHPKILILDDSTSAVDTKTDALIRRAFREELPDTTKIIIAQRITSVEDADLIVVLDGGTISGVGTHDTLLKKNDLYREVYTSQQKKNEAEGKGLKE